MDRNADCVSNGGFVRGPAAADWRTLDPENTLVIETSKGRIVVEMSPLAAPNHVERMKTLARARFYDGIIFHRVISGFMLQGGCPEGSGRGGPPTPRRCPRSRSPGSAR